MSPACRLPRARSAVALIQPLQGEVAGEAAPCRHPIHSEPATIGRACTSGGETWITAQPAALDWCGSTITTATFIAAESQEPDSASASRSMPGGSSTS